MELYITRHGLTGDTLVAEPCPEPILTEVGVRQAQLLGARLSRIRLDAILASPLTRAVQTANEVAVRQKNGPAKVELLLDMIEVGTCAEFTPRPYASLSSICPTVGEKILKTDEYITYAGAEESEESYARAQRVIRYVRKRFSGDEKVLLVAHGTFNNDLILAAIGFPFRRGFNFSQENTGLTLIRYLLNEDGSEQVKLSFANSAAHLLPFRLVEKDIAPQDV